MGKNRLLCLSMVAVMVICFSGNVFAASGFVFKPLIGYHAGIYNNNTHDIAEGSATARLGYQFASSNKTGFTLFIDVGYSLGVQLEKEDYSYDYGYGYDYGYDKTRKALLNHNYFIGLMPTLNVKNFSFGIGGGVKVPFARTDVTFTPNSVDRTTTMTGVTTSDYDYSVTPYVKGVIDYSLYVSNTVALVIAADFTYDFELDTIYYTNPENFYVGLQLGMKFGKKVDNREYAMAEKKQKVIKAKKQKVIKSQQQMEETEVIQPAKAVVPPSQSIVIDIKVNGDKVAPSAAVPAVAPVPTAPQPVVITVTQPPVQPVPVAPVPVAPVAPTPVVPAQ